jgi:hypothetical protein
VSAETPRLWGHWVEISADPTGKRIAVRCICSRVLTVALDALESGESSSCGCRPPTGQQHRSRAAEAEARQRAALLGDWRPRSR